MPATFLASARTPLLRASPRQQCLHDAVFRAAPRPVLSRIPIAAFSSTPAPQARKKGGEKKDTRIRNIRYFLHHPLTPRPLRFSRNRALRHWTIHRAWQLYQANLRNSRERELERQYNSMWEACEALRLVGSNGMSDGPEVGRLYRMSMLKTGVWDGVPIEYAKPLVDYPSRDGWNHEWTR